MTVDGAQRLNETGDNEFYFKSGLVQLTRLLFREGTSLEHVEPQVASRKEIKYQVKVFSFLKSVVRIHDKTRIVMIAGTYSSFSSLRILSSLITELTLLRAITLAFNIYFSASYS